MITRLFSMQALDTLGYKFSKFMGERIRIAGVGEDENRWQGKLYSATAVKERARRGWSRGEGLGGDWEPQPSRDGTKNVGERRAKGRR